MFRVIVGSGSESESEVECAAARVAIGKSPDNLIVLLGSGVSGHHASLVVEPEGLFVEDLGSRHGTRVNGARVERHGPVGADDRIEIGSYVLRVPQPPPAAKAVAPAPAQPAAPRPAPVAEPEGLAERTPWKRRVHEEVLRRMDLMRTDVHRMERRDLEETTRKLIGEIVAGLDELPEGVDRELLAKEVLDEAIGLGPLEDLLADSSVTEIMVNRWNEIFVERGGVLEPTDRSFSSDAAVFGAIERIVAPLGRRIDEASPMVDGRLTDGSRVNAIIPPIALRGPTLTIRKFSEKRLGIEDLIGFGALDAKMAAFLRVAVERRCNVVISGGTGSGKTTLLNVLSSFIPPNERIITVEDAAELRLDQPHLISLEARPANVEDRGEVSIRDLVRNCLRMRPDRIVVGECRGGEALDMLQAMNTGHDGSLTTAHANSPRDMLARLEVMVLMAGMELPVAAIRQQVASAIDLVIQQTRFPCGSRIITQVSEVTGVESGTIQLQDVFVFRQHGTDEKGRTRGSFEATGAVPEFYQKLREAGLDLDLDVFHRDGEGRA